MAYQPYMPSKIAIERRVLHHETTQRILSRLGQMDIKVFDDLTKFIGLRQSSDESNAAHPTLVLAHQKSQFLKPCPGTQNYICCGYQILNLVNNCELNCSYCILQGYLNHPYIIVYVNIEDLLAELSQKLTKFPNRVYRIGTGELADSLSTDHLTNYSSILVEFFANQPNAIIELKTKTTLIDNFIHLNHRGRTVVAWSLNTPTVISEQEPQAPTLDQRLEAAIRCMNHGFRLAFHFDPMIFYEDWEQDYYLVIKKLFERINPDQILWISLGALRYPAYLHHIIQQNHPSSKIIYGELFPGKDGKLRYFKPLRIQMFHRMGQWIRELAPSVFVYLCMESSEVWQKSLGWTPKTSAGLKRKMDQLVLNKAHFHNQS